MRSLLSLLLLSILWMQGLQAQDPKTIVQWTPSAKHLQGDEYELTFKATIADKWVVYSMYLESDDGPFATTINYDNKHQKLIGKAIESTSKPDNKKSYFDETFDMNVVKYKHDMTLVQRISCKDISKPIVGYVESMCCIDERCLPPTPYDFSIDLSKIERKADNKGETPNNKADVKSDKKDPTIDKKPEDPTDNKSVENNPEEDPTARKGLEPAKWTVKLEQIEGNEYKIVYTATIDEGWNIYSKYLKEGGPQPTTITFDTPDNIELIGDVEESTSDAANRKESNDPTFKMKVIKFKHDYTGSQKFKVKDTTQAVKGFITFMVCDKDKCLAAKNIDFSYFGAATTEDLAVDEGIERKAIQTGLQEALDKADCGGVDRNNLSLWMIFIFGFLGGLFALLTPCVFPMVPLTVSYFTKRSRTRAEGLKNAFTYGGAIIVIYVTLGMLITILLGESALNWLSTHWIPNTAFFVLFVAFAISFFGYYDIALPASWSNSTDQAADRGGLLGIFFMAFTLSLVSFSCTGPIIGTLLVQAAEGGRLAPAIGMFGFALALALPFGLFSAFPGWLNSLPKSGGWMNTVKVVLGFIELALAFKFLSKADLTMHWGILKYETYMMVTLLCALAMGIYLLGFIRFPHDDKGAKIGIPRKVFGLLSIGLAAYLGTGFMVNERTDTYATPGLMSGIAPPACYSYFHPCDCPAGIQTCYKDFDEGMAYAKSLGKPVMVDFTGHGCENCRKMEDQVWVDTKVNLHLNEDYVLISLYVDDRTKLDSIELDPDGNKLRTVGNVTISKKLLNHNMY